jgi:RNA polymerase sigma-70 factor, ECF subfamily
MGEDGPQKSADAKLKLSIQEMLDDGTLMLAVFAGDASALEVIYRRYSGLLFPLCRRILKDELVAEEVLQDVFCELWKIPRRFDPARGSLIVYLVHLTRSRAIDRWRKNRRLRRKCCNDSDLSPLNIATAPAKNEPPHMAALFEQINRMKCALGQLSALQRRPIELAFRDGLSHTEIARLLAVPLGTIKARIRSGLIHLRNAYEVVKTDEIKQSLDLCPGEYMSCSLHLG